MRALIITLVLASVGAARAETAAGPQGSDGDLSQQLARLVPRLMQQTHTPGVAVAVIDDGHVQLVKCFGVRNLWDPKPIQAGTLFDAASLGKPLEAYLTFQWVTNGALQLDAPLESLLGSPFLEPPKWASEVTLRRVLAHTSGLPNRVWERVGHLDFRPGERFQYSGNGYILLQEALERLSGQRYEALVRERLLNPLRMDNTSFVFSSTRAAVQARGHVPLVVPLDPFLRVLFAYCAPVSMVLLLIGSRVRSGIWSLTPSGAIAAAVVALAGSMWPFVHIFGRAALLLWVPMGLVCLILVGVSCLFSLKFLGGSPVEPHPLRAWVGGLVGGAALIWITRAALAEAWMPLPIMQHHHAIAPSSMSTTIKDMGRFAAELTRPSLLPGAMVQEMRAPQVWINDRVGWALGIGVEKEQEGRTTYWQWGDNPGSQSLLVVEPERAKAVVVLTNGGQGFKVARPIADMVLGVSGVWSIR